MTVKELIEKLKSMPREAIVAIDSELYLDKPHKAVRVESGTISDNLVVISSD